VDDERQEDPGPTDFEEAPAAKSLVAHRRPSRISLAACPTADRMRQWAPQRHRLLSIPVTISASEGLGFFASNPTAFMIMPDVQNPHWKASWSMKARWTG